MQQGTENKVQREKCSTFGSAYHIESLDNINIRYLWEKVHQIGKKWTIHEFAIYYILFPEGHALVYNFPKS